MVVMNKLKNGDGSELLVMIVFALRRRQSLCCYTYAYYSYIGIPMYNDVVTTNTLEQKE